MGLLRRLVRLVLTRVSTSTAPPPWPVSNDDGVSRKVRPNVRPAHTLVRSRGIKAPLRCYRQGQCPLVISAVYLLPSPQKRNV